MTRTGKQGKMGRNGHQCKTTALDVNTFSKKPKSYSKTVNTRFSTSIIDDRRCKGYTTSADQTMPTPHPPKQLNSVASIHNYKQFLIQNLNNSQLVEIVLDTIESIETAL